MMSDPKPQYVNINGEIYCYRESGEGDEVIILLHGLAETSKVFWRKFIPYFQKTGECINNWKVVKDQQKFEDEIMKSSSARTTQFSKRGGNLSNSNNKNKKTRKKYKKYKKY